MYRRTFSRLALVVIALMLAIVFWHLPARADLDTTNITQPDSVTPGYQQQTEWCWVASASMALDALGVSNMNPAGDYQCGFVGVIAGMYSPCFYNCTYSICNVPGGSGAVVARSINVYSYWAHHDHPESQDVLARAVGRLSEEKIKQHIDDGDLLIVGERPSPTSGHMVLLSGYSDQADGFYVVLDDPWPWDLPQFSSFNPYDAYGATTIRQYEYGLPLKTLRNDMSWSETVIVTKR